MCLTKVSSLVPTSFPSLPRPTPTAFQLYTALVVGTSIYLIWFVAPKHGRRNILIYVIICSIIGSISVIGVKVAQEKIFCLSSQSPLVFHALVLFPSFFPPLFQGPGHRVEIDVFREQSAHIFQHLALHCRGGCLCADANELPEQGLSPPCFCFLSATDSLADELCLSWNSPMQALDTFNTALVTPIYYVIFTTCTIVASALLFEGWSATCDPNADKNCTDRMFNEKGDKIWTCCTRFCSCTTPSPCSRGLPSWSFGHLLVRILDHLRGCLLAALFQRAGQQCG